MFLGNFSFAILLVGIIQVFIMIMNWRGGKMKRFAYDSETEELVDDKIDADGFVDINDFRGIEITFDDGTRVVWLLKESKQFTIHENELIVFDENGKFNGWYNLSKVRAVEVISSDKINEESEEEE